MNLLLFFLALKFFTNCHGIGSPKFQKSIQDILIHSDVYFVDGDIAVNPAENFPHLQLRLGDFQMSYGFQNATMQETVTSKTSNNLKILIYANKRETVTNLLQQIGTSKNYKMNPEQVWILVFWMETVSNQTKIEEILNSFPLEILKNFLINSELYFAFSLENTSIPMENPVTVYYELYSINNISVFRPIQNLGFTIVVCEECESFTSRRKDFLNVTIKAMGIFDPESNADTAFGEKNGKVIFVDGYSVSIWNMVAEGLNLTMEANKGDEWGKYFSNNNSWYGAMKEVIDGNVDLCLSETTMRSRRAEYVLFLPSVSENIVSAFFKTPDLNAIRDIFAQPFKADLWAAVITTWIVLASLMIIFSLIRKRYHVGEDSDEPEPDFTQDSFICALAMACQQGWDEHPSAGSLRTIFISGSFTGVVAYAGYSAAIVSTLSLRVDPIQSPSQLLSSSLKIGMRDGFVNEILQEQSTGDVLSKFYGRLSNREDEKMLNISAGYHNLKQKPYAFVSLQEAFYDTVRNEANDTDICAVKQLPLIKQRFPSAPFVAKNSPYKEFFRYMLIYIREPGLMERLKYKFAYKRRCLESTDNTGRALGANDVFTAFMILIGGYVLSTTFVFVEKLFRATTFNYIR